MSHRARPKLEIKQIEDTEEGALGG